MKKGILIFCLLFASLSLWAQYKPVGLGLDLSIDITRSDSHIDSTSIEIQPVLSLMLNDRMEVAPFLIFKYGKGSRSTSSRYHYIGVGLGTSLNWYLVTTPNFRLGTGVAGQVYLKLFDEKGFPLTLPDSDLGFSLNLSLPLVAEVVLTPHLSFRGQLDVVEVRMNLVTRKYGFSQDKETSFAVDTLGYLSDFRVGVYYRF